VATREDRPRADLRVLTRSLPEDCRALCLLCGLGRWRPEFLGNTQSPGHHRVRTPP
jgi:hypothetical protein